MNVRHVNIKYKITFSWYKYVFLVKLSRINVYFHDQTALLFKHLLYGASKIPWFYQDAKWVWPDRNTKKTCFTLHSSFEEAITQTKNKTICLYWRWPINWLRLVLSLCIVDGQNKNTRGEMIHQISHHSKHIYPLPCAPPPSFACIFEVSIVDPRLLLLIQIICIIQIIIQDYNYNLTDRKE